MEMTKFRIMTKKWDSSLFGFECSPKIVSLFLNCVKCLFQSSLFVHTISLEQNEFYLIAVSILNITFIDTWMLATLVYTILWSIETKQTSFWIGINVSIISFSQWISYLIKNLVWWKEEKEKPNSFMHSSSWIYRKWLWIIIKLTSFKWNIWVIAKCKIEMSKHPLDGVVDECTSMSKKAMWMLCLVKRVMWNMRNVIRSTVFAY